MLAKPTMDPSGDLGEPTHTLIPCWMHKSLPQRNQCMGWFAPAPSGGIGKLFRIIEKYANL
jgi:hypothetical protein